MLFLWVEKSVKLSVDHIGDLLEVLGPVPEFYIVGIHYQKIAVIILYPVLVFLVQAGEIVYAYALLVFPAALLYLGDEVGDGLKQIN